MAIKKLTDRAYWSKLGPKARDLYRKEIFDKGRSVYGDKWWGGSYSPEYKAAKKAYGGAFANKVTPVLTSGLFKDFKGFMKPRHNGLQLGYPTYGERVAKLRKKGRSGTLTSHDKPLPDKVLKYIKSEYHKYIKKNSKNTTRVHKLKK